MHILLMEMELHLPNCHSLKEKRSVIKPLLNAIRRDLNVSAAETAALDHWQSAVLAAICVSGLKEACERNERDLLDLIETHSEAQLAAYKSQWL